MVKVIALSDVHLQFKAVLESFYRQLSKEQLASIKVVTGDGAKWITDCVNGFTPDCERCVDQFHLVQWAMDTSFAQI